MDTLLKLTNAPFKIEFAGKPYEVKKATLEQVIKFMQKQDQLKKDNVPFTEQWVKLVVFATSLTLSAVDPSITEDFVSTQIPGNVDAIEVLTTLGFINPKRAAEVKKTEAPSITPSSSPSSPTEQDGSQTK